MVLVGALASPVLRADLHAVQLSGRVVDESGAGVPAAMVEVWSTGARIAGTLTREDGTFTFADHLVGAARLTVAMIGFRTAVRPVDVLTTGQLSIVLQREAIALPQIVVDAKPLCPVRDSRPARLQMAAAAARYRTIDVDGVLFVEADMLNTYVRLPGPGAVPDASLTRIRYNNPVHSSLGDSIRARGFASFKHNQGTTTGRAALEWDAWSYPELDARDAYLFASSVFLDLHNFAYRDNTSTDTEIVFCPKSRSKPGLDGVLVLAPDTSFATASWSFASAARPGDHGGETVFAPMNRDSGGLPVSARGSYWYRLEDSIFAQRSSVTNSWRYQPLPVAEWNEAAAIYSAALDHLLSSKVVTAPAVILPHPIGALQANRTYPRMAVHPAIAKLPPRAQICREGLTVPCVVPLTAVAVLEVGEIVRPDSAIAQVLVRVWTRADYITGNTALEQTMLLTLGRNGWVVSHRHDPE